MDIRNNFILNNKDPNKANFEKVGVELTEEKLNGMVDVSLDYFYNVQIHLLESLHGHGQEQGRKDHSQRIPRQLLGSCSRLKLQINKN